MQRYEHFEIYANAGTKFIKILKIIFTTTIPLATFPEKHRHFPKKIDRRHLFTKFTKFTDY